MLNSFRECIRLAWGAVSDGTNISSSIDDDDDNADDGGESEGDIFNLHMLNKIGPFQQEINACDACIIYNAYCGVFGQHREC